MQRFKSKGSILANKINCVVLCETKIILSGFKSKKRFYRTFLDPGPISKFPLKQKYDPTLEYLWRGPDTQRVGVPGTRTGHDVAQTPLA